MEEANEVRPIPTASPVPQATTRLLTMKEAAAYLGLQPATLYEWVSERKISYTKMGRLTKFDKRYLDKFIEQHTVKARQVTHGTN